MTESMTSTKPYMVRAFYEWISDNQMTPYIVVDVSVYGVSVPLAYVNDGQIILNISLSAVGSISMVGEQIEFSARFGGKLENLTIPYGAIAAIYAKENGAGTSLAIEHAEPEPTEDSHTKAALQSSLSAVDAPTEKKPQTSNQEMKEVKQEVKQEIKQKVKKGRASLKIVK